MRNQEAEERSNARKERGQEERRVWRAMERAPEARRSTALAQLIARKPMAIPWSLVRCPDPFVLTPNCDLFGMFLACIVNAM